MMSVVVAVLFLFNTINVNGQWCTGWGYQTQSRTASEDSVGYITSRFYPSYYSNNVDCRTTISKSGAQILFYVETQSIENYYDYLKIYSDSASTVNLEYHSDSNSAPYVGLSSGTDLIADFHSDYSITYGGFLMWYIAVDRANLPSCGSSIQATSTDQQLSFVYREQSSPCTWTITPESASHVEVKILLVQGSVQFSDGTLTDYYYTANSIFIGESVHVTGQYGNDFVVVYKQVGAAATGVFISTSPASDSSVCSTSMRTSYDSVTQYLQSPSYPGEYNVNIYCSVNIEADDSSQSVFLNITDYSVSFGDSLVIYDGSGTSYNRLGEVSTGNTYTSSSSNIFVVFETNDYGGNRGFQLTYQSVIREIPTCSQSPTLDANVTASTSEQVIESPSYPGHYSNNDVRYWLIVKPSESDNIVLDFRTFSVEEATDCRYDYVSIYDGACTSDPLIAEICGHYPVTFEDSTGLYILIKFYTDGSVTSTGWRLTYYIGAYQDPDAGAATDESSSGIKDYIYPIIGIAVIVFFAVALFTFLYCKGKGRVGVGEAKLALKRRTTHDLLTELTSRYGSAETDKQPKVKRKGTRYHPQPNPPGPNVTIINTGGQSPHPPPGFTDPAYPPVFIGTGSQMPTENIAPVLTQQSSIKPSAPEPDLSTPSMIPPPFPYSTPAEARAAGQHGLQ